MNNTFYDVAINLGSAVLFFLLGIFVQYIIRVWRQRGKRAIWKLLNNGKDLSIALTTRDGPELTSSPRATFDEVLALTGAFSILQQMPIKYSLIDDNETFRVNPAVNILSIGGEKANKISSRIWNEYSQNLPVRIERDPYSVVIGEKRYTTEYADDEKRIVADYGVVLVVCTRDNLGKMVCRMVAFGLRGFGTRGAVQSISSREMIKRFRRHSKTDSFVAVVRITENNEEIRSTVEEFYPLDSYQ